MNKLIIATVATGAAVAGLLLYLRNKTTQGRLDNNVSDAARDAYNTMNKHIGKTERTFDYALN